MKLLKSLLLPFLFTAVLFLGSCIKDPQFKPAEIGVSSEVVDFGVEAGSETINLFTNRDWKAEITSGDETPTWLTLSDTSGVAMKDSLGITITVLQNDGETRQATINFRTETVYASVRVTQKGVTSSAVTKFADDFSSITEANKPYEANGWTFYSTDASDVYYGWRTGLYDSDGSKYIQVAPYKSSQDVITAYAAMPLFNVADASPKTLQFSLAIYYQIEDNSKLEVVASTDYNGDFATATWTLVYDATYPSGSTMNTWKKHSVDLTEILGSYKEVTVAFRYTGKSNTYRLDDVKFADNGSGGGGQDPDPGSYSIIGDYAKWNAIAPVSSFGDDFSSITTAYKPYLNDNWMFFTTDGSDINYAWKTRTYNADKYLDIAPYGTSASSVTAYALIPRVNVSAAAKKNLKFKLALYYQTADASKLEVVTSENFTGDFTAATWTVLQDVSFASDATINEWISKEIDLSSLAEKTNLCIAFRYTGKANTYRLDDVQFAEGAFPDPGTGGGGGGEGGGAAGDGVYTSNVTLPADTKDVGTVAYGGNAKIGGVEYPVLKLGKKDVGGSYTFAAPLPMTGNGTISFYGAAWNGFSCTLTVTIANGGTIDGAASKQFVLNSNSGVAGNPPYTITFGNDFYKANLAGITSASTITLSTENNGARCVLVGINVKAAN